jgi:hypothetical protein
MGEKNRHNNSLKRTIQSLRDWICCLAHALNGRFFPGRAVLQSDPKQTLTR